MIGYYVHHVGVGHAHRAEAIAAHLPEPVTALSSLPRPTSWKGIWLQLPRDDQAARILDPTAGGVLHWAPRRDAGLRNRMGLIADWISRNEPCVLVSDLSAEVAMLGRLMGVPVVVVALPGRRDDPAHQLSYAIADTVLAPWPRLSSVMAPGLERHAAKVRHVGGMSRFDGRPRLGLPPDGERQTVLALSGLGGADVAGRALIPGWRWTSAGPGNWHDDPWPALCAADVIVTHCGLGALSDVAAVGKPAVLLPQPRPHDEQAFTARAVAEAGLAVVLEREPSATQWLEILDRALLTGGERWSQWSSGHAAVDAAQMIIEVARAA